MKPLVCYHKGCMDGAGAALAAYLKFGEEAEYRAVGYGDPAPTDAECHGRDVYVLDFSWPRAELQRMDLACAADGRSDYGPEGRLVVLDHHKTAQKELDDLPFCTFDMTKSGAVLSWIHFNPKWNGGWPELFAYIQDRDLWQWKLPYSKEISAALFSTGATDDFRKLIPIYRHWESSGLGAGVSKGELVREGEAILRTEAQMVARCVSTAEEVVLDGHRCLAVSCPLLQSEVGEALAIESARRGGSPIGVVWHRFGERGTYKVSLRSRDVEESDVAYQTRVTVELRGNGEPGPFAKQRATAPDVSAIAKKVGDGGTGGGHHRAAGFECKTLPWMVPDGNIAAMAMAWQEVWKKLEQKGMLESFGHFPGIGRALAFIDEKIK